MVIYAYSYINSYGYIERYIYVYNTGTYQKFYVDRCGANDSWDQ